MATSLNEFGFRPRSAMALVVVCLSACGPSSPSGLANQMRTALSDLASAEDVYYATNLRYSADQSLIMSLTIPRGITLTVERADQRGWRATASHVFANETCSESGRNDGTASFAVLEGPSCTAAAQTAKEQQALARKPAAATPMEPDAPQAIVSNAAAGGTTAAAAGEVSLLLPAVGTQTDDFGYPTQTIDRLAVRRLLVERSYDALDRVLAAYADSVMRDYRLEYRLLDAYEAFDVAVPPLEPQLTEWVQRRPASAAALLARGTFFMASGWHARGEKFTRETRVEQIQRMGGFFRRSADDFSAALDRAPSSIIAYRQLMVLAMALGDVRSSRSFLDKGLKIQPNSFELRASHIRGLLPRWGGSYEAMARFAAESAPYANHNPRIKALGGFVDWDKGRVFERNGKKGDAIEAYQRALRFGNFWQFRNERGSFFSSSNQLEDALEDFNGVLAQYPQDDDALNERARVEYELGRQASGQASADYYSQAFRDIVLAVALDPANEEYQEELAFYRQNIPEFTPPDGR